MTKYTLSEEIKSYACLSRFREPLMQYIISDLQFPYDSSGLDAGCGIGFITNLLWNAINKTGKITGLDISEDLIQYAQHQYHPIYFTTGDVTRLPFGDQVFDWIWSADTVWPGSKELGCPSETPFPVLTEYKRVLKRGGKIILLYWSSQKILPGYPLLEARLNATESANAPFVATMNPGVHIFNAKQWLQDLGLTDIQSVTYVHHLEGPFTEDEERAMQVIFQMLWSESKIKLSAEDQALFLSLTNPGSKDFILNSEGYYGFYTYSVFSGHVPELSTD